MLKACTSSNQTKFQHWEGERDTKSHLCLRSYLQLIPTGKVKISLSNDCTYKPYLRACPMLRSIAVFEFLFCFCNFLCLIDFLFLSLFWSSFFIFVVVVPVLFFREREKNIKLLCRGEKDLERVEGGIY